MKQSKIHKHLTNLLNRKLHRLVFGELDEALYYFLVMIDSFLEH